MHRTASYFAIAALLGGSLSGCSDFLSGPTVDSDPNNPTVEVASANNLFVGFQATQFANFTATLAVTICGYVQGCKGAPGSGRFVENQLSQYQLDTGTFDTEWIQVFGTGGLRDIRTVRQKLEAASVRDPLYEGVTKVWEALIMSEAADKWGDIPYSEAASDDIEQPQLDDQAAVYTALLQLIDEGLAQIADPAGIGAGAADLVYGSLHDPDDLTDYRAAWTAMAHTLKARIYLHQVRAQCSVLAGCPVYNNVIAEATQGLPLDGSLDFTTVVSGASALESSGWWQFYILSGFGPDLRAGDFIVTLMSDRDQATAGAQPDPRFNTYFAAPAACGLLNPAQGMVIARSCLGSGATFPQPWVTGDENALMLAEAYLHVGGGDPQAQLNAVKAKYGAPVETATLAEIIEEKYVTLFQNFELWNDYKRTCLPALTPTFAVSDFGNLIPRRAFYGEREDLNNLNIPEASVQLGPGGPNQPNFRNDNDVPGTDCSPIALP